MRGSKKTSVDPTVDPVAPTTKVSRYAALHNALETGGMSLTDVLDAAQQLAQARLEAERQPVAPPRPAGAFNLKRALTQQGAASPLFDEPWRDRTTEGPADLIRHFAIAALTEYKPEIARFDEDSYALIMDVAEFAVNTALRMAGVSESWADEYRELTAHLRK